ncbi:MAG: YbhB/YbcL family Raf kinase inhibitor-like protein [Myxococcales bacterium]|nr:YbhB/YbcL family Raf kinase inhibitor-like protein [Myxococcales bacterium]
MATFQSWMLVGSCLALLTALGCGDEGGSGGSGAGASGGGSASGGMTASGGMAATGGSTATGGMAPFAVTSDAFEEGGTIPQPHECGPPIAMGPGSNVSPALTWTPGPPGTASYAVVVHDVDAKIAQFPNGIIHWVIYDIPASTLSLSEGIMQGYAVATPSGAKQGEIQGSGYFGYFGPCSPNSVNTYVFTVHALPEASLAGVSMASSESEVAAIVEQSSIAQASLSGES